jgi:hypothetical protein
VAASCCVQQHWHQLQGQYNKQQQQQCVSSLYYCVLHVAFSSTGISCRGRELKWVGWQREEQQQQQQQQDTASSPGMCSLSAANKPCCMAGARQMTADNKVAQAQLNRNT